LAARTDTFWIYSVGSTPTQYIVFDGANSGLVPPGTYAPVTGVPAYVRQLW
jgi:hypothetical protein